MGETLVPDREIEIAIEAAAARIRSQWGVDVPLRAVSREADEASAPDDVLFMAMGGSGSTHVMYGPHRHLPRGPGVNRWKMAKVRHSGLDNAAERFARKAMGEAARNIMVSRALAETGVDSGARPGWAFIVHPLARRLVETSGVDLDVLDRDASHLFSQGLVGIWTARERWIRTVSASIGPNGDAYEETSTARTVELRSATLPESTLPGIHRMPLDLVVEHPRLAGSVAVVNSARNRGRTTMLSVAIGWTTLRDPPRGLATPWLTTLD